MFSESKKRVVPRTWVAPVAAAVLAFAAGWFARSVSQRGEGPGPGDPPSIGERTAAAAPTGVTGIGGVFFKSGDPERLSSWYLDHLDVTPTELGVVAFQWREAGRPEETGYTVWSAFPDTAPYFEPSGHPFMINFRVGDLRGLIDELRSAGVEVVGEIEEHPNGRFAWILDPEGRKVELWEPVPSAEDPYLR